MTATQSRPTKPSEVLEAAAVLIEPEGKWTQGEFWRLADGTGFEEADEYGAEDPRPSCFCLFGAMAAVRGEIENPEANDITYCTPFIARAIGMPPAILCQKITEWNDDPKRTQAEVVKALRDAAELARSEGQ
jgi:hypothetical protein